MLLKGKKALITGGSRGIGRDIVLAHLKNGASVYYVARSPGDAQKEYEAVAKENGVAVTFCEADVGDEAQVTGAVERIVKESGGIDVYVNNAGITRDGLIFRMAAKDWQEVIQVNLTSAFYISKIIAREMIKRRGGSIIFVTSIVGLIGNGGQTNYSASKAGLIGFTKSLAREVASRNVRVNAIAPGYIRTDMTERLNEAQRNLLLSQIPMGRIAEPEEVANVVLFLASELSSYITGQVLEITGGMAM